MTTQIVSEILQTDGLSYSLQDLHKRLSHNGDHFLYANMVAYNLDIMVDKCRKRNSLGNGGTYVCFKLYPS